MNIVIKTAKGATVTRPDTTWERDNEDLYLPDFVSEMSYTPVLFARICKPGRSISKKFASRYYDAINYGVLLYPEDMINGDEEGYAAASCLDHSSFLPSPFNEIESLSESSFILSKDENIIFSSSKADTEIIESAIEDVTKTIYIRTGDIVAIELQGRQHLFDRKDGNAHIHGKFLEKALIDFKIIVE